MRRAACVLCAALASSPVAAAQHAGQPAVTAVRLEPGEVLRLDGRLDERAWSRASAVTDFRQREPAEGAPATEATEVRVLYDGATLYVGVAARDRRPGAVVSRILLRDRVMEVEEFEGGLRFAGDDAVAILLDPFHDHRNAVVFATNPNGAELEALVTDEGRELNVDWRTVWHVAAARTADGWSAEFAIPFRSLRYPTGGDGVWGFNVYRIIRRKNEDVLLAAWSRSNEGFHRVSRAAHLAGLDGLPAPRRNLEMKPYLLAGATQEAAPLGFDTEPDLKLGLDAKYQLTSGLLLDLTANTDFAQVEADDEQVNLTRFDLFFPEKRDFFLENAGVFEFGFRSSFETPPFLLLFTRRIGIHPDSGAVPVLGGVRLTGRAGAQTVGLFDVVTERSFGEPRTNYAVLRAKRDVAGSGYVGVMVTDRRHVGGANTAAGLDASLWPRPALNLQGFVALTHTTGAGGEGIAYRVALDYQRDRFGVTGQHLAVSPDARADLGFIQRTDIRRSDVFARLTPRPRAFGLRKVDVFWNVQLITATDGRLVDWFTGPAISPVWDTGEDLAVFAQRGFTRLDERFILGDVEVPPGDYDAWQLGWFANSAAHQAVTVGSDAFIQWTFGGVLATATGRLTAQPNANVSVSGAYSHHWVALPGGAFTADVLSLRLAYAFSTRVAVNALIQYNGFDDEFSVNVRLNVIHRPGSDLFVVFNERRGAAGTPWRLTERSGVVKVTYLVRP